MHALDEFRSLLEANRAGRGGVAVSVCSAHPLVLRAAFRSARRHDGFALVEATSNQVDQYGGYTGLRPADFARLVHEVAAEERFPRERVLLGGDHLGTNRWREQGAAAALEEAKALVAAYVEAGFRKIHLDASFVCAGDPRPLTDELVAERCAALAAVAERAGGEAPPVYVVGTEVPTPGGAVQEDGGGLHVTTPAEVERTVGVFRRTFAAHGLQAAWERVVGLVVQPGVEFGDGVVHDYVPAPQLAEAILRHPGLVYEAHSTDYQSALNLRRLAADRFFILKVGPWLTFALREALFLLELAEKELRPFQPSRFRDTLADAMKADPRHWAPYYTGPRDAVEFKLAFSYSDRARYYLGRPEVQGAVDRLLANLSPAVPDALVSQFLPAEYAAVRAGRLSASPRELAIERVCDVLEQYLQAGEPEPAPRRRAG